MTDNPKLPLKEKLLAVAVFFVAVLVLGAAFLLGPVLRMGERCRTRLRRKTTPSC